jgi:cytoskeletal protein CcmA (bactofilin family)
VCGGTEREARVSIFGSRRDDGHSERSTTFGSRGAAAALQRSPAQPGTPERVDDPGRQSMTGIGVKSMVGEEMANIGKSISIKGDLTGNEDLVIEGKVEGKVELPNNQLTIGANGQVKAEINAKAVIVIGRVSGNVRGTERIEIQATGVVEGDVAAPRLLVAEGAVVNGSITMSKKEGAAAHPGAPAAPSRPAEELRKVS